MIERSGCSLKDACPFNPNHDFREVRRFTEKDGVATLAEVILNPTRIYVDPVVELILESRREEGVTVSYTHLTLPTNREV